jgi:hypothetical protein
MTRAAYNPIIIFHHKLKGRAPWTLTPIVANCIIARTTVARVRRTLWSVDFSAEWGEEEYAWFERLLEEQDVDIMAWALGTAEPDPAFAGPLMDQLMQLDFITLPEGLSTHKS